MLHISDLGTRYFCLIHIQQKQEKKMGFIIYTNITELKSKWIDVEKNEKKLTKYTNKNITPNLLSPWC